MSGRGKSGTIWQEDSYAYIEAGIAAGGSDGRISCHEYGENGPGRFVVTLILG